MELSIIIVTYNSEKDIKKCIDSILEKTTGINYEIVIVDNSSQDNTRQIVKTIINEHSNIKLIKTENRGFNAGNNIGIRNSTGEFIALLNPDTILLNNAFKIIIDNMKKYNNVGACGAALYSEDGNLTMSHGVFPNIKETILRSFRLRNYKTYYLANINSRVMEVDYPSGADFVFKRELIDKVGLMDEEYFIYFDETDYALRFKKAGLKQYLFTEAKIIHAQGNSTGNVSEFAQEQFFKSYVRYLNKNLNLIERHLVISIKLLEHKTKYVIFRLLKRNKELIENHKREIKFYSKCLSSLKYQVEE